MTGLGASIRFAFETSANRASIKYSGAVRRRLTLASVPDPLSCRFAFCCPAVGLELRRAGTALAARWGDGVAHPQRAIDAADALDYPRRSVLGGHEWAALVCLGMAVRRAGCRHSPRAGTERRSVLHGSDHGGHLRFGVSPGHAKRGQSPHYAFPAGAVVGGLGHSLSGAVPCFELAAHGDLVRVAGLGGERGGSRC